MSEQQEQIDRLLDRADQLKYDGKNREAVAVCEKILAIDLDCVQAYEEIGDNYISLRELEKAEKALQRALSIEPDSANAEYLMGFMESCRRAWRASIVHLERADELKPNHQEILRCLGWSLYSAGDKQRGIVILERALTLAPTDVFILTDLGVCHLTERNTERALEIFRKVLELDPDNQKARECLAVIEDYTAAARKFEK